MLITPIYTNKIQSYNRNKKCFSSNNLSFGANFTYDKLDKSAWYDTYIQYGNEKESEAKVLKTLFDTKIEPQRNLNIVDIGSGNGLLSNKIIADLSEIYPKNDINYIAIDNSEKLLRIFSENCKPKSNQTKIQPVLQDFFAENRDVNRYDYAIAAHSMYRSDLVPSLKTIQKTLKNDGKAFIIRSHPDSLMNYFRDKYHIEIDSLKSLHPKKTYQIPDLLKQTLENEGIQYKSIEVPYQIKLPNDMSSLKNILSFIIDAPIENLSSQKLKELFADIERLSKDGMLHCKNNIFVILKR